MAFSRAFYARICVLACVMQALCLLAYADVGTGLVVRDTNTDLMKRANQRQLGPNNGLAIATVTGGFVLAAAVCSASVGAACIVLGVFALLQGWALTFLSTGSQTTNPSTTTPAARIDYPVYDYTVLAGGGSNQLDQIVFAIHGKEKFFGTEHFPSNLEAVRNMEPHYLRLRSHGDGTMSSKWFINETVRPGIEHLKRADGTTVTELYYTWDNENEANWNEYDKSSDNINNEAQTVANFMADNFSNKFCLGFDDDDQANPLVNNGEIYVNQEGPIDDPCNQPDQGVF